MFGTDSVPCLNKYILRHWYITTISPDGCRVLLQSSMSYGVPWYCHCGVCFVGRRSDIMRERCCGYAFLRSRQVFFFFLLTHYAKTTFGNARSKLNFFTNVVRTYFLQSLCISLYRRSAYVFTIAILCIIISLLCVVFAVYKNNYIKTNYSYIMYLCQY